MGTPDQDDVKAMKDADVLAEADTTASIEKTVALDLPIYKNLDYRLYFSDDAADPPNALRIVTTCAVAGTTDELAENIIPKEEIAAVLAALARAAVYCRKMVTS